MQSSSLMVFEKDREVKSGRRKEAKKYTHKQDMYRLRETIGKQGNRVTWGGG